MKYLLLIIAMVLLFGCGGKDNGLTPGEHLELAFKPTFDTVIKQDVWYSDGEYHIQTYIMTQDGQLHPPKGKYYSWASGDQFCPYFQEVSGTFEEMMSQKEKEYNKAAKYFEDKKREDSIINDHLNQLKK